MHNEERISVGDIQTQENNGRRPVMGDEHRAEKRGGECSTDFAGARWAKDLSLSAQALSFSSYGRPAWNIGLLGRFRSSKGDVYPLETSG